ncbi:hypothetical protein CWB72_20575, partial [Pseudoalteromonas phenolica]|uniref:hypothetical protein n=1 Tax=Pseudoalteromonas phenolica TaxID=161398 RepID=UPI00127D2E0C
AERKGKLLLKYRSFQGDWEEAFERINRYHLTNYQFKGQYRLEVLINLFVKRSVPSLPFYGSSMFWAISPGAAEYVLDKVDSNKKLKRFFHFTWGSDEFIMQTILMSSPFAPQISNENCHYYEHPPKTPSPKIF